MQKSNSRSIRAKQLAIIVLVTLIGALHVQASSSQQQQQQQPEARRLRSVAGGSISSDMSNAIDHGSGQGALGKSKQFEIEKRQLQDFLSAKHILKLMMRFMGNRDEVNVASRSVIGFLGKVLELFKTSFGQKSRSANARTVKDSAEDVAVASISMIQGYVKSMLASETCRQRYLCQASKDASREGREFGGLIARVGAHATSYLLENDKQVGGKLYIEASHNGLSDKDCIKLYPDCQE